MSKKRVSNVVLITPVPPQFSAEASEKRIADLVESSRQLVGKYKDVDKFNKRKLRLSHQ